MRERRRRAPTTVDKGQHPAAVGTSGEGVFGWLRAHIGKSIIGAALVGALTGWLSGFFDSFLHESVPSGAEAFCVLRETVEHHWPFARQQATPNRFSILIAAIDRDDSDHTYTRAVARAFFKWDGIDRIETCRILRLSGVGRDAEVSAQATARNWLNQRHADLLIAGEMQKKDEAVYLWFFDKDPTHNWTASTFTLHANFLKQDFSEATSTQLVAVALSAIKPTTEDGRYLVEILKPVAERLQNLLKAPPDLTATQKAELNQALGTVLRVLGEQAGDKAALAEAVSAYRAALAQRTRDQPFDWATTQNGLANALLRLSEWESGTTLIEQAVAAYHLALEVRTRKQVPLEWATTQHNLGVPLWRLSDRESGTKDLTDAVAAYNLALEERTRDRVPLDWAATQQGLGDALERLGERESGTTLLEKAVAAYDLALEEYTRDRVPLDWAVTQNDLGVALVTLGERESGTTRLEAAVAAFDSALKERTRDRVPLDWAMSTGNQGVAVMLLAERLGDAARARAAVEQIEVAFVTIQHVGNAPAAGYYGAQLPRARALLDRLTKG